jgi:hypothetical protein
MFKSEKSWLTVVKIEQYLNVLVFPSNMQCSAEHLAASYIRRPAQGRWIALQRSHYRVLFRHVIALRHFSIRPPPIRG